MKNINIGSRLKMAASFIEQGKTVCDVGCDHGKLSLYLLTQGRAEKIIATDINKLPLQKAVDLLRQNGLSHRAECLLTDGLQGIEETKDISHVLIAGLSGQTMCDVIAAAPFIKAQATQLVLLPAQGGNRIRDFLYKNGFSILQEKTVGEKGKYYAVIKAVYTGDFINPSTYDCFIGESGKNEGEDALGYFKMVLSLLQKKQKGLVLGDGEGIEEVNSAIEKIKKLIKDNID